MAKVLVTGASGFIGSHLVKKLQARGDDVTCLVRSSSSVEHLKSGVRLVYGDVCRSDSLERAVSGADVVYHLAGKVKSLAAHDLQCVNTGGVHHVAKACADQATPPVLVLVSSLAAAGPSTVDRPRTEADPAAPVSRYGQSKRGGEIAAHAWANRVPITVVRPPVVVGEGDQNSLSLFKPIVRWGIHLVPGFSSWRLSMIHADDLADSLIIAAERGERLKHWTAASSGDAAPTTSGYYFAADDGLQPTYDELGRIIGQVAGRQRVCILRMPRGVVWLAVASAELGSQIIRRANIFNLDKAREATAGSWTCSARMLRESLGFAPARPLIDRLGQTAEWYRKQRWI